MNFNKLGIAVLSAGAIFMATSCQKDTVSLKQATKWVESNFTPAGMKETGFKKLKVTLDASGTKGDDAIGNVRYMAADPYGIKNFDEKTLKGDATYTKDNFPSLQDAPMLYQYQYYFTADTFVGIYTEESVKRNNIKFSIKDNRLTVSSSIDAKDSQEGYESGKIIMKDRYNKEGATLYSLFKMDHLTNKMYKDQVVNFSVVVTLEY